MSYSELYSVFVVDYCDEFVSFLRSLNITDEYVIKRLISDTLHEYSLYDPIIAYKRIETKDSQTVIDIYKDISPYLIELFVFRRYDSLSQSLIDDLLVQYTYIQSDELQKAKNNPNRLYEIILDNFTYWFIRRWKDITIEKLIFEGRFIKVIPNSVYEALYARKLTCSDFIITKKLENIRKLLEYNALIDSIKKQMFRLASGNILSSGIRSVNISGMNVSFNSPDPTRLLRDVELEKQRFLRSISNDDDFMLPEYV